MAHDFEQPEGFYEAGGGRRVGKADRPSHRPHEIRPQPYFQLMHAPTLWECMQVEDVWTWVPKLKRLYFAPGVNAVRQMKGSKRADASLAIVDAQTRGFTVIPEELDGGYIAAFDTTYGRPLHTTIWEHPTRSLGVGSSIKCDEVAFAKWRVSLVTRGIIDPPTPELVAVMIDRQRRTIDRSARDAHIPSVARRLAEAEALIEGMAAAAIGLET